MNLFDYKQICYTLLHNKNHHFVQFNSYFKNISKFNLSIINALYSEFLIIECNRPSTYRRDTAINHYSFNPYLLSDFKNWIIADRQGFPRLNHLLDIYTNEQLFNAFQELTHKNFIKSHTYKKSIYLLYPVLNQFLPLSYAYVKLLYHIKKLYQLQNDIIDTVKNIETIKQDLYDKYNNLDKVSLIDKLISNDISKIEHLKKSEIDKNSILFQSIIKQLTNYVLPLALQTYLKPLDNSLYNNQSETDFNDLLNNDFKSISQIDLKATANDIKQHESISDNNINLLSNIGLNSNTSNKTRQNKNISDISLNHITNDIQVHKSINQNNINPLSDFSLNTNHIDLQPLKNIQSDNISEIDNLDIIASKLFKIDKTKSVPDSKTFDSQNTEFFSNLNQENFSNNESINFSDTQNEKVFLKLPEKISDTKEKLLINPKTLL